MTKMSFLGELSL